MKNHLVLDASVEVILKHKNHWLYEQDVKVTVKNLEAALQVAFVGTKTELNHWGEFVINFLSVKNQRIRDRILSSFQIFWQHDEQNRLNKIEIHMLPWAV